MKLIGRHLRHDLWTNTSSEIANKISDQVYGYILFKIQNEVWNEVWKRIQYSMWSEIHKNHLNKLA